MLAFNPRKTALVLIDLQHGILSLNTEPQPSGAILAKGKALAEQFRAAGAPVVLVNVGWSADYGDAPKGKVDSPSGGITDLKDWMTLAEGLVHPGDILVTKHQWGAFTGTDLDLQLRRRGIDTIVLAGIATNIGVESTGRFAWELGYNLVVVEDACACMSAAEHQMSFNKIFPRIGRVISSAAIQFSAEA